MKDRIVIKGQNGQGEDILIAIQLQLLKDKISIWTFPIKDTPAEFVKNLYDKWEDGAEKDFPHPHLYQERGIDEENLLPEDIKTVKTDVIKIAEQEWRVRVLSHRLYEHLKQQIDQLQTRAGNINIYSKEIWEEAKSLSNSIKEHTLDRNIKREQTTELRNNLDEVFNKLKSLQDEDRQKFVGESEGVLSGLKKKVDEIMQKGGNSKKVFESLKQVQTEAKGMNMLAKHRNDLRSHFNKAFEKVKSERKAVWGNRLSKRVSGLEDAIKKMEDSIARDKSSLSYQTGRIDRASTTQLEYQLRSAKLKLIEERIQSKGEKLHNMYTTLESLKSKKSEADLVIAKQQAEQKAAEAKSKAKEKAAVAEEESKNDSKAEEKTATAATKEEVPVQVDAVKEATEEPVAETAAEVTTESNIKENTPKTEAASSEEE